MSVLAALALIALAGAVNVSLVLLIADRFGHEGSVAGIIGAVPTAA
ncbi:hypothetical protein [Methylobacterium trifolii]|uniref:MFS transporter n=1 Tax=Methylobacterium trifolii TaxID=1003092 RepID=A0ABQ4TX15_9HYPH|nr:hypothetical protein [Methylobacterium trifolii]GJE59439.1 hypothetical protein MPOCJGCO_1531 [Methylobacterium trifolii]